MGTKIQTTANNLLLLINTSKEKLDGIEPVEWDRNRGPGKWTKKEILGHLIDSAANNHQRFLRLQFEDNPKITYDQNKWVTVQNYTIAESELLIDLWYAYNTHLVHVIKNIPEESIGRLCEINKEQPVTLEWLANDYVRHMQHHLGQII